MSKEKISKYLLSSCNKNLKQKVERFLFQEEDEEFTKNELSKVKFYNYFLFSQLDIFNKNRTIKKSEDSKIIRRLFLLGYKYFPEKLISDLKSFTARYSFYKELKFSESFIIDDMEENFKGKSKMDILSMELTVSEIEKKFSGVLDRYLIDEKSEKNRYSVAVILSQKISKGECEKLQDLEYFILKSLSEIYSSERIKNILKYDFEREDLVEKVEDRSISSFDTELVEFLRTVYCDLNIESSNRDIILGLLEILTFSESLKKLENKNNREYFSYIDNSKLPFIYKLVYLYQAGEKRDVYSYLNRFITENSIQCEKLLDRMCHQNIELGAFILGILIQKDKLNETTKQQYVEKYELQLKKILEELDIKENEELEVRILNSLGYMLVYSNIEEYIGRINEYYLKKNRDKNEFINIISHFERLIEGENRKNPWKIISEITSIDKKFLIVGTVDFVVVKSAEKFTEFLKENEDIFYELLTKKVFTTLEFEEIIKYSYRSGISFDFSKLLPYLTSSDESLISTLFEILKDREQECGEEVEKLFNGKNKKLVKNIENLKKLWESNKKEEFDTLEKLVRYSTDKLEKEKIDVPYSKNECYGLVRERESELFIDEKVIKFYVSLYISNNSLEDIEFGKNMLKFFNLKDLRECIGKLFELWIENKTPKQYINIVKLLTLVADEFWLNKILTQCDLWLKRGKIEIAIDTILSMLGTKRKDVYTEFEYIHLGLKNREIKGLLESEKILNTGILEMLDNLFENKLDFSLGFDKTGNKILDYGKREIKLQLDNEFNVTILNQDNKELKTLPKFSNKFDDIQERVEFYQNESKIFKKKREFILKEVEKYLFYQMIGERVWNKKEWQEEFLDSYILKISSSKVVWQLLNEENKLIISIFDLEKESFVDIFTNESVEDIKEIRVFYSGECSSEEVEKIKERVKTKSICIRQFEIPHIYDSRIDGFDNTLLKEMNIMKLMTEYFMEFVSGELYNSKDKLFLLDKVNKMFAEFDIVEAGKKDYYLENLEFYTELKEVVDLEKINRRFLNFVLFTLEYMRD